MEIIRTALWGALFFIIYLLYNAWQSDYPLASPLQVPSSVSIADSKSHAKPGIIPESDASQFVKARQQSSVVTFETDIFRGAIDTRGGHLVRLELLQYDQENNTRQPFKLLSQNADRYYVAQTHFTGLSPDKQPAEVIYKSPRLQYYLSPDQQELQVNLRWQGKMLSVVKQFVFKRQDYQIRVNYHIENLGTTPWEGQVYAQLYRKGYTQIKGGLFSTPSYTGGVISTEHKPYEKVPFEEMAGHPVHHAKQGWIAMVEPYFLTAWIPDSEMNKASEPFQILPQVHYNDYVLRILGPKLSLSPQEQSVVSLSLYAGPTILDQLKKAAKHLDLTVDYGMLWFVSTGLFWLLKQLYQIVGNWGWAIIFVTVLLKMAFYGLSAKSFRSMLAMRNLQPKLQALKTRYGDDRQKLAQETMALYRKERVSPLGGCLPMLIQIPVFIALYWVLLESVELRHAPFILWIKDLSAKDPWYVLPILMGVSMFLQQKLNPPPADPMQAKLMLLLPVFCTAIFLNFPSGLVLYWLVNNTLSILQHWWMLHYSTD